MVRLDVQAGKDILEKVYQVAQAGGWEVYAVGGFVRDLVMEQPGKDIDFVLIGDAVKFATQFSKRYRSGKVVTFERFGTAMINYQDWQLEFVTARSEHYEEHSRKPVVQTAGLKSDLSRRDFTINCLAMHLSSEKFGEVIDVYDGLGDIDRKIIRTPLDPVVTFNDDPLRILRAIRFAARLGFTIEPAVAAAIEKTRERLSIISQERITEEFRKIMLAQKPSEGLNLLRDSGISAIVFPELDKLGGIDQRKDYHHKDVFYHTLEVIDNISEHTDRFELRMAALLHDIAKPNTKRFVDGVGWTFHGHEEVGARMTNRIGRRMRLPVQTIKYLQKLVRLHLRPIALVDDDVTDSAIRRLMFEAGNELEDLMMLCRADITSKNPKKVRRYLRNFDHVEERMKVVEEKDRIRNFKPAITGEDIMKELNIPPGRQVGTIKQRIVDAILDGEIPNDRDACLNYFNQIKDSFSTD